MENIVTGALVLLALGFLVSDFWKRRAPAVTMASEDEWPRCVCGEPATEPMPTIRKERGLWDWQRSVFARSPRYKRYVDRKGTPALCAVHAQVADTKIDEFIFVRVRGILAETNARIAAEAAAFEKEVLPRSLVDSLTATERKSKTAQQTLNGKSSNGVSASLLS